MSRLSTLISVIAGAVAGAVVALVIAGGSGSSTHSVTTVLSSSGSTSVPTSFAKSTGLSINQIYRDDSPGVVDITVTAESSSGSLGFFGGGGTQETEDEGAGVVYDKQGDIVTDEHVVANATSVEVHFDNGVNASAKVLGSDASTDVAVIKVDVPSSELHPISFADSSDAQVGDAVVAIGSPFSYPETATAGIVSAVGRSIEAPNGYTIIGAIQTDAAINPGNSGGPLLDAEGQVLGLNDQIDTDNQTTSGEGSSSGVGFATPGNTDVQIANEIISGKPVEHSYVGVCLNPTTSGGAQIATSASSGCPSPVAANSPASRAGLQPGDVITAVNGKAVTSTTDFIATIGGYPPGQTVTLTIKRN
jgi:putative serine protease PepD